MKTSQDNKMKQDVLGIYIPKVEKCTCCNGSGINPHTHSWCRICSKSGKEIKKNYVAYFN